MTTLNDAKHAALLTLTGQASGDINDMYHTHLKDQVLVPRGETIPDLEAEWLFAVSGLTTRQSNQDMWMAALDVAGIAPGHINDRMLAFWLAGGMFVFDLVPVQGWTGLENCFVVEITYLLSANFNAADSGALASGDLEAQAPGAVQVGALDIDVDAGGVVEIEGNQLKRIGDGSNWDAGTVMMTAGVPNAIGLMMKDALQVDGVSGNSQGPSINFQKANDNGTSGWRYRVEYNSNKTNLRLVVRLDSAANATLFNFEDAAGLTTQVAMIAGGFDVNGVPFDGLPFQAGDAPANFGFGCSFYYKSGGLWTLIYRSELFNDTNLFPMSANRNSVDPVYNNQLVVAQSDANLLATFQPAHLSTTVVTTDPYTHPADAFIEVLITTLPSAGNLDIVFRQQDATHRWILRVSSAGAVTLVEDDAGETVRATAGTAVNGSVMRIRCIADSIIFWTDGSSDGSFTSALFQTDTDGLVTFSTGDIGHVSSWPLTDAQYDVLDNYMGAA